MRINSSREHGKTWDADYFLYFNISTCLAETRYLAAGYKNVDFFHTHSRQ